MIIEFTTSTECPDCGREMFKNLQGTWFCTNALTCKNVTTYYVGDPAKEMLPSD